MEAGAAARAFAAATPAGTTLKTTVDGFGDLEIKRLTIIGTRPGPSPEQSSVVVADIRWLWARRRIRKVFNLRRDTGERRRLGGDLPLAIQPVVDDVGFAPWTLDGQTRFTPQAALRAIFEQLTTGRDSLPGETFEIAPLTGAMPIESLVVFDTGQQAVRRMLGYFGGLADVFIDADGTAKVFDRSDGGERAIVGEAQAAFEASRERGSEPDGGGKPLSIVDLPLWGKQDRSIERPREVRIQFSRLAELRFDSIEGVKQVASNVRGAAAPLELENVLPVPDPELVIRPASVVFGTPVVGGEVSRIVRQGAWIRLEEAIDAWNLEGWPGLRKAISRDAIRQEWFGAGLFEFAPPDLDDSGVFRRRIAALKTHYRQTYRVIRGYRDRIGSLQPHRSELADSETGTRAPAEVYQNYATRLSVRGREKEIDQRPQLIALGVNRFARADKGSVVAGAIDAMQPAPAVVTILDQDEGVIRLNFLLSPTGDEAEIVPSALDQDTIPRATPDDDILFLENIFLTKEHEVSVVLSTVPVSPNDDRVFHEVTISKGAAEAALGFDVGEAKGPPLTLTVLPRDGRGFARFRWDETTGQNIKVVMSASPSPNAVPNPNDYGELMNADEIEQLALAAASRFYFRTRDRIEGQLNTGYLPGARPAGSAGPVIHSIAPDGAGTTNVEFLSEVSGPDLYSFLPEHIRQTVLGEVLP